MKKMVRMEMIILKRRLIRIEESKRILVRMMRSFRNQLDLAWIIRMEMDLLDLHLRVAIRS